MNLDMMAEMENRKHDSASLARGAPKGGCDKCLKKKAALQRSAVDSAPDSVPPIVHDVLRSPGQPLDLATRAFMEPRFRHDFSRVQVHTDAKAAESARAVNALAYTVGRDVVFGEGQYAPGKAVGKQLLAHELTHTIQQSQGQSIGAQAYSSLRIGNPVDSLELEARAQSAQATKEQSISPAPVQGQLSVARLQRQADISQAPPGLPCVLTTGPGHLPGTDVLFSISSSTLTASQKAYIATFVSAWVAGGSRDNVIVEGWASVDGPQPLNWRLSCERAESVKDELVVRGVPAGKVTTFAHGESTEFSTTDLAKNRRAIITRQRAMGPTPLVPPTPKHPTPTALTPVVGTPPGMRLPTGLRFLDATETAMASSVYGSSLNYSTILLSNALGFGGRPFTVYMPISMPPLAFGATVINIGPGPYASPGSDRDTLIHELAHCWQSQHHSNPYQFMINSVASQAAAGATGGDSYCYIPGKWFGMYGAEQIAEQIENGEAPIIAHVSSKSPGVPDAANMIGLAVPRWEKRGSPGVRC